MRAPLLLVLVLVGLSVTLHPVASGADFTLNKCTDDAGAVTYTNKPCGGGRETQKLAIDPAPEPLVRVEPAVAPKPVPAATVRMETLRAPTGVAPAAGSTSASNSSRCETLSNQVGRVLDKMDQARRKGYTQKQMDAWNEQVRELEQKKQQQSCF